MAKEIKIYTLKRRIGKYWYSEQICAKSTNQAKKIAKKIGAKLDGKLIETLKPCGHCGMHEWESWEMQIERERDIDWVDVIGDDDN
ncbi:MAG: hypothetical protein ACK5NT_04195 [Pyrinomonadaceae bacterium]